MAPYYPLYVRRSDGKLEISTKKGTELNEPLPEQLDTTPNAQGISDFYRQCMPGEPKEIDWRRKLGGMLVREVAGGGGIDTTDKNYILAAMPLNYRVYEHVKCKLQDANDPSGPTYPQPRSSKSHAAGGNERQDAYLYGHPFGRKKRYRSPAEFFPHLLWLATDEEGDTNNCSCKFCSPEELETEDKTATAKAAREAAKEAKQDAASNNMPAIKAEPPATGAESPAAVPIAAKVVPATTKAQSAAAKRAASQSNQQKVKVQSPPPQQQLPRFRSQEQRLDAQYNEFIYRPGEIVWFSRVIAWGLAVIVQRQTVQTPEMKQYLYRVQPLSHPFNHPAPVENRQEDLRPWLAWSPPACTCPELNPSASNSNHVYTYASIDWQGVLQGRYGPGDAEVDGSIMAVKALESTFTLFDRIDSRASSSGASQTSEISYNGMYLGGEKIWLGDLLRIRNGPQPTDVGVLTSIIERTNPQDPSRPQITLIADTYSLRITQLDLEGAQQAQVNENNLPPRLREDLRFRNQITSSNPDSTRNYTSFWKLNAAGAQLTLADVKGRWYESSILMPILDQQNFARHRANGEIQDAGLWMNSQGDCNKAPDDHQAKPRPAEVKTKRREDAFGRSIPPNLKISAGLDDPEFAAKQQQQLLQNPAQKQDGRSQGHKSHIPSAHGPNIPPAAIGASGPNTETAGVGLGDGGALGQQAFNQFVKYDQLDNSGMPGFQ